jgi:hypothetical protein
MHKVISLCVSILLSFTASAGEVVFEGYPSRKVEVTEQAAATYEITKPKSIDYKVLIEREGENYYWRTRNNIQLVPMKSGAYVTFLAVNGSGYVRILNDNMREMYKVLPEEENNTTYLYMEHLIHQMGSITYYGK